MSWLPSPPRSLPLLLALFPRRFWRRFLPQLSRRLLSQLWRRQLPPTAPATLQATARPPPRFVLGEQSSEVHLLLLRFCFLCFSCRRASFTQLSRRLSRNLIKNRRWSDLVEMVRTGWLPPPRFRASSPSSSPRPRSSRAASTPTPPSSSIRRSSRRRST